MLPCSGVQEQFKAQRTLPAWLNETEWFWISQRHEFIMVQYTRCGARAAPDPWVTRFNTPAKARGRSCCAACRPYSLHPCMHACSLLSQPLPPPLVRPAVHMKG